MLLLHICYSLQIVVYMSTHKVIDKYVTTSREVETAKRLNLRCVGYFFVDSLSINATEISNTKECPAYLIVSVTS